MYLLFSFLTIAPLIFFVRDPQTFIWSPWLSLGILFFGSFILIPKRRFLFTIPITTLLLAAFLVLVLLEIEWVKISLLIGATLILWHWWHLTKDASRSTLHVPRFTNTLSLMTLLFLFAASFAGNAFAIYLDEPIWKISTLLFIILVTQLLSYLKILSPEKGTILPAMIMSIVTIELFLATFYLPISFYTKSIVTTFFGYFILDLYLRHCTKTLTLARVRAYLIIFLAIVATILSTAEWI